MEVEEYPIKNDLVNQEIKDIEKFMKAWDTLVAQSIKHESEELKLTNHTHTKKCW